MPHGNGRACILGSSRRRRIAGNAIYFWRSENGLCLSLRRIRGCGAQRRNDTTHGNLCRLCRNQPLIEMAQYRQAIPHFAAWLEVERLGLIGLVHRTHGINLLRDRDWNRRGCGRTDQGAVGNRGQSECQCQDDEEPFHKPASKPSTGEKRPGHRPFTQACGTIAARGLSAN